MILTLDPKSLKKATARALICICEAESLMSSQRISDAIALKYEKRHTADTLESSLNQLMSHKWINDDRLATETGRCAYHQLLDNKASWVAKFFALSQSPNVGARAPTVPAMPPAQKRHVFPAIPWLRPDTW